MDRMTDLAMATKVATLLVQASEIGLLFEDHPLKKVWVYGPVTRGGLCHDIDIALEVDGATFSKYVAFCRDKLGGVNPVSDDLLAASHSASWDSPNPLSPKRFRSAVALSVLGFSVRQFGLGSLLEDMLDIVCLPEGWDDEQNGVAQMLCNAALGPRDPKFFEQFDDSKVLIFQR